MKAVMLARMPGLCKLCHSSHFYTRRNIIQHSTAQHSTAQHSTAQHSTAQHSTAQHSTAQHSTAQHIVGTNRAGVDVHMTHQLTYFAADWCGMKVELTTKRMTQSCSQASCDSSTAVRFSMSMFDRGRQYLRAVLSTWTQHRPNKPFHDVLFALLAGCCVSTNKVRL